MKTIFITVEIIWLTWVEFVIENFLTISPHKIVFIINMTNSKRIQPYMSIDVQIFDEILNKYLFNLVMNC